MKTTAEEKLMLGLERVVIKSARTMKRAEFVKARRDAHLVAMDVIRTHRHMIQLWTEMDKRMTKKAIAIKP